ncbi:hypothetical protein Poli38472_000152 [Pythium oligandrum]|uniref:Uncharacterized protein n=1 Tax=Pythium oligandrum TaxID=41045 RepID=A0A8K1CC61_PYTOL|nr:hypothetical protein Poli38472_000152 [Pythium oligandrum]|eukprot:TMW60110.1 hypothetical protein Poli38472_000152 [Pythium oligandrum]
MEMRHMEITETVVRLAIARVPGGYGAKEELENVAETMASPDVCRVPQKMAVCEATGLVAVANGHVVDVYQLDELTTRRREGDTSQEAHLPYVGQIVLRDHLYYQACDGEEAMLHATSVYFASPGFLLVAASQVNALTSCVWLSGFRIFARSVTKRAASSDSPTLMIHLAFADRIEGVTVMTTMTQVPSPQDAASVSESGAVVALFQSSSTFAVFRWRERFSDRDLLLLRLPMAFVSSADSFTAAAVSNEGQSLVVSSASGVLALIDLRGLFAEVLDFTFTGRRLEAVAIHRMGHPVRDSALLERLRLLHHTQVGGPAAYCTTMRWWRVHKRRGTKSPRYGDYLLVGTNEGAFVVLHLTRTTNDTKQSTRVLKMIETYPALRSLKNDPIRVITPPQLSSNAAFVFQTFREQSRRTWTVSCDTTTYRLTWPSLQDSLRFPVAVEELGGVLGGHDMNKVESLAAKLQCESTEGWKVSLLLTSCGLRMIASRPLGASCTEVESAELLVTDGGTVENDLEDEELEKENVRVQPVISTEDRYQLPSMSKSAASTERTLGEKTRLTRAEFNQNLATMAQRVDRLSSTLGMLRHSFSLFTQDVKIERAMEKGYLQAHAELARLDDSAARSRGRPAPMKGNQREATIPHFVNETYDPEHPDADWGGYVQRTYKKRLDYAGHTAVRDNLVVDPKGGIMPDETAATAAGRFSGKKIFEPHQVPMGEPGMPGIQFQSAVYQVGPGNDLSCRDWKTSYEAQTSMEAASKDMYAMGTRRNSQHKRHVTPLYEQALQERKSHSGGNPAMGSRGNSPLTGPSNSLNGSESSGSLSGRRLNEPRKSLLAGIGKAIAAEDTSGSLVRPELHLPQSYTAPTSKTLLTENHHPVALGYTGRKSLLR